MLFLQAISNCLQVKVVNPDWLICTIADACSSFHADIIVETGALYTRNDVRDAKSGVSIDVLPIDATFMLTKELATM